MTSSASSLLSWMPGQKLSRTNCKVVLGPELSLADMLFAQSTRTKKQTPKDSTFRVCF